MPTEKPVQYALTRRPLIGGMPLVGVNSLPSIKRAVRKSVGESQPRRSPVRMTESPSGADQTTPSTALMTDGNGPTIQSPPSVDSNVERPKRTPQPAKKAVAKKVQPAKKANTPNVRSVDELDDDEDDF